MIQPKRRFHFTLDVQADDMKSLISVLENIVRRSEQETLSFSCVSGGYDSGYYWTLTERPEQTHEKYIEELNTWLEQSRKESP